MGFTRSYVPVGALGDGYAATIGWVCDLLGWSMLLRGKEFSTSIEGIVLVDELEKHLHPSWQQHVLARLARELPRVQFITTTHSPLTTIGSSALPDDRCQLLLLEHSADREGGVSIRSGLTPPRNKRADQVLTSNYFGLAATTSSEVEHQIARYAELAGQRSPSRSQREEMETLGMRLQKVLAPEETEMQRVVRKAVTDALDKLVVDGLANTRAQKNAMAFEVRRQLGQIFNESERSK